MQHAERWALLVARPLTVLAALTGPVVWLLGVATDATIWLFGGVPDNRRSVVTEEEIRDLVAAGGMHTAAERQVITGALEATHRTLRQVVRPRTQVVALADHMAVDEAVDRLRRSGHTRAPVYHDQLDDAERVVSLLDLVGAAGTVADHAGAGVVLPESVSLIAALRALQAKRHELAIVVSEHGGVEGLVTVEDLVEEFVGEIHDLYERDVCDVVRHPDGSLTLVGHVAVDDLVDLDVDLPTGST